MKAAGGPRLPDLSQPPRHVVFARSDFDMWLCSCVSVFWRCGFHIRRLLCPRVRRTYFRRVLGHVTYDRTCQSRLLLNTTCPLSPSTSACLHLFLLQCLFSSLLLFSLSPPPHPMVRFSEQLFSLVHSLSLLLFI